MPNSMEPIDAATNIAKLNISAIRLAPHSAVRRIQPRPLRIESLTLQSGVDAIVAENQPR
jgi:hypothetical protein